MQTDDADRFLIDAVRAGDQRAWHQFIERYQGRLIAFAASRLGRGGDAEDAVQETFLGFVTSLRHFNSDRPLETYLFAILRYKIGEVLTKRQRRPDVAPGFDVDCDAAPIEAVGGDTPSQMARRAEVVSKQADLLATILRRLIEELRDRGKLDDLQVIELLFYVGLRNKEAADLLGRDEKAVAGVKFRALARLREYVEEMGPAAEGALAGEEVDAEVTIARVWRERRLSCLKRGTLGSYLLGVLEEPWLSYTAFHLETVKCLMCRANAEDLAADSGEEAATQTGERMFQSSVGFLSRPGSSS